MNKTRFILMTLLLVLAAGLMLYGIFAILTFPRL